MNRRIYSSYEKNYRYEHYQLRGSNVRFSVYIMNEENPDNLELQVSEIHPYDEGEYVWAKMGSNKQIKFIKGLRNPPYNRVVDKLQYNEYYDEDYASVDEYIDEIVNQICIILREYNEDVDPIIIHN